MNKLVAYIQTEKQLRNAKTLTQLHARTQRLARSPVPYYIYISSIYISKFILVISYVFLFFFLNEAIRPLGRDLVYLLFLNQNYNNDYKEHLKMTKSNRIR